MRRFAAVCVLLVGTCFAVSARASSPRTVVVDDFNGTYTTLATTIFGPQSANPANWPWVFLGFGPPAAGVKETTIVSPLDPGGAAWRYNMPNQDTTGEPFMPFAAILAWFGNSYSTETWDTLSDYLIGIGELPIDWQQPVTFKVEVYGLNAGTANFWQQRLVVDQAAGSVIDDSNAAVAHPVSGSPSWQTLSLVMNGQPNPPQSSFLLEMAIDFQIIGNAGGQNYAIFDYLRMTYTPKALVLTETDGNTEVDEQGPTTDTYDLHLTAQPANDVMVLLSTDGQCEIISPNVLTFTSGAGTPWDVDQTVTVRAVDDPDLEAPVHSCVVTHSLSSADANFNGLSEQLVVTVLDNDQLDNGTPCTQADECVSTNCVDGVCCDTECTAAGFACNVPMQEGICLNENPAPSPALSPFGLGAALLLLMAIAALALRKPVTTARGG